MEKIFELTIEDISTQGEGIGKKDGQVVFVAGAYPGDRVLAEVTEDKGRFLKARVAELLEASKDRVEPACKYYSLCGGCPLMPLSYEAQLRIKEKHVKDALTRIGGFDNPAIQPIIGAENPWRYRNKAEFAIQGNKIGYYQRNTHSIVEIDDCPIQNEAVADVIADVAADMKPTQKYFTRLVVRTSASGEVMTIIENKDGGATADMHVLHDEIRTDAGVLKTEVSPLSFYQVNPAQTGRLYSKVQEYADLQGGERILDLYCGAGSIGLSMAKQADKLIGVESVKDAVIDANRNAVINGIVNDQFICGKAEEVLPTKLQGVKADVVILDPPRGGCDERLLESVCEINLQKLIYVSCNPATLARDLRFLCDRGFELAEVTPCDMFPQTLHVETVVLMSK